MTTPTQHLEIFDKGLEDVYYESREYTIKQHLIQTVISVLEEQVQYAETCYLPQNETKDGATTLRYIEGEYANIMSNNRVRAIINSLTTTLSTWKALQNNI